MVSTHDIHITWPHPVPSGNAFIAGTWSVPGHGPWDKLQMTRIPGTDSFEIHLDVQEIEDISDYLDEDGYLHHELLDHHHPHDHSHQHQGSSSSPPLTPSSTATHLSRRKRISRFFGRARSSSSASTTSTTSNNTKDQHIDLPHHHQSKDGTFLPLAREYRFQYKFVIDDEWKCDHDRPQVQDSHGHWNHELAVELVEQFPAGSSAEGRSRSSSLQSQHGPQLGSELSSSLNKPLPVPHTPPTIITTSTSDSDATNATTTSIIVSPAEEGKEEVAREEKVTENVDTVSAPVPAIRSSLTAAAARSSPPNAIPTSTTIVEQSSHKSRDTYEAVLIFDETDDLSDGEGGRSKKHQVIESDDDEDEELKDNNNSNSNSNSNIDNNNKNATEEGNGLLGEDVDVAKAEVTPQQDDHASLSPVDQQENYPSPVVINVSAANTADDTATLVSSLVDEAEVSKAIAIEIEDAQAVEEQKEEEKVKEVEDEDVSAAIEDVFVNSSSVPESLPQLDEPSIIIPADSSSIVEEEEVAPAPIAETAKAELEIVEVEEATPVPAPITSSPVPASIAIPASPVFSFESVTAQSHLLSPDVEPEAFVLQAAVNFDEEDSGKDNGDVSEVDEPKSSPSTSDDVKPAAASATKPAALEVITDASAIAAATAAAAAAAVAATVAVGSATTTANDYSQVPSPPLTPSNLTSSKRDLISSEQIVSVETELELEKQNEGTFERSVYMTPRAESTLSKHTSLEDTSTTTEESFATAAVVDENVTIDILDDKDLTASLLSSSSSSSSLSTLTGGHGSRRSSNSSTSTKATSSSNHHEAAAHDKEHSKKSEPEQHPSLFWSFCKTTAVVSAAVVVLGLGLGRRRD
ncbi:hypothetical protein BGZ96_000729 [Linnemannia gamsii]|uniref:AMP-activated protein kinase glycogen-binding domain-containing protein n=1 Tax=Linnemannia gamsii TaxID=64522 RepID=A0ABQ7JNJ4_9FUNG|nr:hypothetical protein BGZ96_000729 [Linnemannia gamsii]